jgi:Surface antigen variable number repeat
MRVLAAVLLFSTIVSIGLGQEFFPESGAKIQIHRLAIEADGLSNRDRERIIHLLEGCICSQGELDARIGIAFRDLGYFHAHVDEPSLSFVSETQRAKEVNVSVRVDAGAQYRLGEISFQKGTLFPTDRMRKLFPIQTGDLFNVTKIVEGLEQLRSLYGTEGYVDFVASPMQREKPHRTLDLVIEIEEGKPYDFGPLLLEGIEPHAGAGKALLESWKTLQDRRYSPLLLKHWVTANSSEWRGQGAATSGQIVTAEDPVSHVVNVKLLLR